MYDRQQLEKIRHSLDQWEQDSLKPVLSKFPERKKEFITTSSEPIENIYTPLDLQDQDYFSDLGLPGEYPLCRPA